MPAIQTPGTLARPMLRLLTWRQAPFYLMNLFPGGLEMPMTGNEASFQTGSLRIKALLGVFHYELLLANAKDFLCLRV